MSIRQTDDIQLGRLTFDQLLEGIRDILGTGGLTDLSPEGLVSLQNLLASYRAVPSEYAKFVHFAKDKYTRNLVDDGNGRFNLMILAWPPGQQSPIHDHAGSHCLMKCLQGTLQETRYAWPIEKDSSATEGLHCTAVNQLSPNDLAYMHDKIGLHRVANPDSNQGAISLHLYTPPYATCKTFCPRTGVARASGKCLFYSNKGVLQKENLDRETIDEGVSTVPVREESRVREMQVESESEPVPDSGRASQKSATA